MQGRFTALGQRVHIIAPVLRVHVGTGFDQYPYRRNFPTTRGPMQGRITVLVLRVHVGASFKQHP